MSQSKVTTVTVHKFKEPQSKTLGYARVVLNDDLQLTKLRIVAGCKSLFVAYPHDPSYKGEDSKSLFFPVTRELRAEIEKAVLTEFGKTL